MNNNQESPEHLKHLNSVPILPLSVIGLPHLHFTPVRIASRSLYS